MDKHIMDKHIMDKHIIRQYEKAGDKLIRMGKRTLLTWKSNRFARPEWLMKRIRNRLAMRSFSIFKKYFIDQHGENEAALAVNFFTRVRDDMAVLDMVDHGYQIALKNGTMPKVQSLLIGHGEIENIFDFIFYRWPVLCEIEKE
jgi:hypothetical protein